MRDPRDIKPNDTCIRCGLRRVTRELEQQGITIRLCDDCYWGSEPASGSGEGKAPTG